MSDEEIQGGTAITTAEYEELKKKADILDFLFGEDGIRVSNLEKIQIWREKAELVDSLEDEITRRQEDTRLALKLQEQLEAVRDYIGKLRDQAEDSGDIFERGFCRGMADELEKILEAKVQ